MLLSAFGIILGVAVVLAIGATNLTVFDSIARLLKDTSGRADLIVTSTKTGGKGLPESLAGRVADEPGVAAAIPVLRATTMLAKDAPPSQMEMSFFGASVGGLALHGIDPLLDPKARDYKLVEGRFLLPDDPEAHEVVLVQTYAQDKDLRLDGRVDVVTPNGAESLKIVGLIAEEGPGQTNSGAFGVIPLKAAQKIFNRSGRLDQIDVLANPDQASEGGFETLKAAVQARLGSDYAVTYPAAQGQRMTQMLGSYQIGLNFMSGVAVFVGAFLIYNAFMMTVRERTREFGMLRTVGMTRRQVTWLILAEALLLGLVGSALGIGLGILLARGLSRLMEVLLRLDLAAISVPNDLLALSAVIGVVVTLLSAAIPAVQAGRVSPLEALRVRGIAREGWLIRHGWIAGALLLVVSAYILVSNPFPYDVQFRLGSMVVFALFIGATLMIPATVRVWDRITRPLVRLLYGNSGRLGSRNLERSRQRTTLTVAALMIGVSMILVVRGMTDSFRFDLTDWMEAYIGGDLYVTSSVPIRAEVWSRVDAVEGVAGVAPVRYAEVAWSRPNGDEAQLGLMAVDPQAYNRVTNFVFADSRVDPDQAIDRLQRGGAIFISSVIAERYGLSLGDTMTLKTFKGPHEFEIAGIVTDFYNQGLVIDVGWSDLRRHFAVEDATALLLQIEPGYTVQDVAERIDAQYGARYHLTIEANQSVKGRAFLLMDQAFSMFDVLALIAMVIAAFGVINTLTMNVLERTQEIGMLRSIGMTRAQVVRMVLAEAAVMGVIGGVLGLVFGVLLSRIFLTSMTAMSGYKLTLVISTQAILVGLVIALIISQLAALLPARRAARIRILEAVRYE